MTRNNQKTKTKTEMFVT